jgi:putative proteasome-type protease
MRSNISVGLPIDLMVYKTDSFHVDLRRRIDEDDVYFQYIHQEWGNGLRRVFSGIDDPDWFAIASS